jgi:hypothetical protein
MKNFNHEWLVFLLRIQHVLILNLGLEANYRHKFMMIFFSSSRKI